jgi:hypothetical protein
MDVRCVAPADNHVEVLEAGCVETRVIDRRPPPRRELHFPIFVAIVTTAVWGMYIYGLFFVIGRSELDVTLSKPISPPLRAWYFYTIKNWPGCVDVRTETGRLFSYQFVHGKTCTEFEVTVIAPYAVFSLCCSESNACDRQQHCSNVVR